LADKRGGYQKPKGPRPPAGPGSLSQRNDANQPVQTPGLENPDLQYGDVGKLRADLAAAPLPNAGTPRPTPAGAPIRPAKRAGGLPSFLFDQQSGRPNEPGTEGLSTGPGAGPEVLPPAASDPGELALQLYYQVSGDQNALTVLNKIRDERSVGGPAPA
jgi:hypothetical protein